MSLRSQTFNLNLLGYHYILNIYNVYRIIILIDIFTLIAFAIEFSLIFKHSRFDEVIFEAATTLAALIQVIAIIISYVSAIRLGNPKYLPYHESAKKTFVFCFALQKLAKDPIECFAFHVTSQKCGLISKFIIVDGLFFILQVLLTHILRKIKLHWERYFFSRAYQQPEQEEVQEGIIVEVIGQSIKCEDEINKAEIVTSIRCKDSVKSPKVSEAEVGSKVKAITKVDRIDLEEIKVVQ